MPMTQSFKGYQRTARAQTTEEMFQSGMNYTETPLQEGYLKEIVNFDIYPDGTMLFPRAGMQAFSEASATDSETYSDNTFALAAKECPEANSIKHGQIITGSVSDNKVVGTDLYKGILTVSTVDTTADPSAFGVAEHQSLKQSTPFADTTNAWFTFKQPTKIEAHGISVDNTKKFSRQVGVFGFNNSYFCFADGTPELKGLYKTEYQTDRYVATRLTPKALTPKEAVSYGYNMFLDDPYSFTSRVSTVGAVQLLGILPYDSDNKLVATPRINTTYQFKCFYDAPMGTKYSIVWEAKGITETSWTTIKLLDHYQFGTALNDNAAPLLLEYSSPLSNVMIRMTCTPYIVQEGGTEVEATNPEQVIVVSFTLNPADYNAAANVKQLNYDLHKCSGMTYWQNRLVCYGFSEDATVLLMSDVNDPTYFPYPNAADIYDEPIVYVVPFLEKLLVFTTTRLYQVNLSSDGTSFYKTELQRNLLIKDWDIHLTKVIKNMLFFKSGNYFYMIVPKATSTTGELVLAPISRNIQPYFDKFTDNVKNTLRETYGFSGDFTLVHYYNYLDYEDVHNVYVFKMNTGKLINLGLLYNTVTRSWRIYVYESQSIRIPYAQDATQKGIMLELFNNNGKTAFQFLNYTPLEKVDRYINNSLQCSEVALIKNYQYLDTGYRSHNTEDKKRYRELQFNINNIDLQKLRFYTGFIIDGEERREYNKYVVTHITDANSPDFGTLVLERALINPSVTPSNTVLADAKELPTGLYEYNDFDHWILDESIFPAVPLWKIRVPVSGKGYSPRVKIISCNESNFELLNLAWVYRTLYSR